MGLQQPAVEEVFEQIFVGTVIGDQRRRVGGRREGDQFEHSRLERAQPGQAFGHPILVNGNGSERKHQRLAALDLRRSQCLGVLDDGEGAARRIIRHDPHSARIARWARRDVRKITAFGRRQRRQVDAAQTRERARQGNMAGSGDQTDARAGEALCDEAQKNLALLVHVVDVVDENKDRLRGETPQGREQVARGIEGVAAFRRARRKMSGELDGGDVVDKREHSRKPRQRPGGFGGHGRDQHTANGRLGLGGFEQTAFTATRLAADHQRTLACCLGHLRDSTELIAPAYQLHTHRPGLRQRGLG